MEQAGAAHAAVRLERCQLGQEVGSCLLSGLEDPCRIHPLGSAAVRLGCHICPRSERGCSGPQTLPAEDPVIGGCLEKLL